MQDLAEGMRTLAGQLDRLKEAPKSDGLHATIGEFPGMMEEVVDFIEKWLESWSGAYLAAWDELMTESLVAANHILILPHKDRAIELQRNLDGFRERFVLDLMIEVQLRQGLVLVPIVIVRLVWTMISATIADGVSNVQGELFVVPHRLF